MSDNNKQITEWLNRLPAGDSIAQREIWEQFADHVAREAKKHLNGVDCRDSDEEDVAIKVLNSFFQRLSDGRQSPPTTRAELWGLLLGMTRNKAKHEARRKLAQKRGSGKVRGESAFEAGPNRSAHRGIDRVPGNDVDPERAFQEAQQLSEMLDSLDNPQMRQIAVLKMAGHTEQEMADILGCGKRTVQRRLEELRDQFSE